MAAFSSLRLLIAGFLAAVICEALCAGESVLPIRFLPVGPGVGASVSAAARTGEGQALFTHRRTQYAAYLGPDGFIVVARRTLGSDKWETAQSVYQGKPDGSIILAVDGAGWLHVGWYDQQGVFAYARSSEPDSLQLNPPGAITWEKADRIGNPRFFLLANGDLIFLHQKRISDNRRGLALSRYSVLKQTWSTVQSNLIDLRPAEDFFWSMAVDQRGGLHLAWTASAPSENAAASRGLAYLRSADGGVTWTKTDGVACSLPLAATDCEYVLRAPQAGAPLVSPSMATDDNDRPYIAIAWAPAPDEPARYQIAHHDGTAWQSAPGPLVERPPTSPSQTDQAGLNCPPILLVDTTWRFFALHLIKAAHDGRITVATRAGREAGPWVERELTGDAADGLSPVIDPTAWQRFHQVHLLVAGDRPSDRSSARAGSVTIGTVIWSPATQRMRAQDQAGTPPQVRPADNRVFAAAVVLGVMQRVADWQWTHLPDPKERDPRGWEIAPLYLGTLALDRISPDRRYRELMLRQATANDWQPGVRIYHADDHCVIQAYLELFQLDKEASRLAPSQQRLDAILAEPPRGSMDWGYQNSQDRWTWCDALFMAPASWAMMAKITGDHRYLDFMNREWWATTEALFTSATGFYFRDESFLDLREPNGRNIHWARGNGWALAGLCRVIDLLPHDYPDLPRFHQLYRTMATAVLEAQQQDGLWRVGLLDPAAHPAPETSGSAFMTFGLAWGINRGLLARSEVEPAVRRAWNALAASVTAEGKLEHVQPIGAAPQGFDPGHTDTFAVGAFLLAGSEFYRLAGSDPLKIQ